MKIQCPKDGQRRIIKRFLLFPRRIDDEIRWLEVAYIKQQYIAYQDMCWYDESWSTKEEYEN